MGPIGKTQPLNKATVFGAVCFEQALQIQGRACILELGSMFWQLTPKSVCRLFARWLVLSRPSIPLPAALPGSVLAFSFCLSYGSCLERKKQ